MAPAGRPDLERRRRDGSWLGTAHLRMDAAGGRLGPTRPGMDAARTTAEGSPAAHPGSTRIPDRGGPAARSRDRLRRAEPGLDQPGQRRPTERVVWVGLVRLRRIAVRRRAQVRPAPAPTAPARQVGRLHLVGRRSPSNLSSIATGVDPGLVDINTTLSYQNEAGSRDRAWSSTSNGEVLTNNHVIEGATSISVTDIGNGKTYTASVVGYDRTNDVAVIQLHGAVRAPDRVTIGDSSKVATSVRASSGSATPAGPVERPASPEAQ